MSVRFGKPVVVDFMEMNMLEAVKSNFANVEPDLWEAIMSKKVMEED